MITLMRVEGINILFNPSASIQFSIHENEIWDLVSYSTPCVSRIFKVFLCFLAPGGGEDFILRGLIPNTAGHKFLKISENT